VKAGEELGRGEFGIVSEVTAIVLEDNHKRKGSLGIFVAVDVVPEADN
jgi:hypothetical protein